MNVFTERLEQPSEQDLDRINNLLRQLTEREVKLTPAQLVSKLRTSMAVVARAGTSSRSIVGMGSLSILNPLSHCTGHIDDVVVDEGSRGNGIASLIMQELLLLARDHGCDQVELTSNPAKRKEAIALYQKLGFKIRETNLYILQL